MTDVDVHHGGQTELSYDEARQLTDESRELAETLWRNLLRLHAGKAWKALKYDTWEGYCEGEFGVSRSRSYQLMDAARVLNEVTPEGFHGDGSVGSGLLNERQARELAPVLRMGTGAVKEVFEEAQREHGPQPTAMQLRETVRETVRRRQEPSATVVPIREEPSEELWKQRARKLIDDLQLLLIDPENTPYDEFERMRNVMADLSLDFYRLMNGTTDDKPF